jgi:anti-sigma factor RsiW
MEHAMADAETESKPVNQDALVADIDRTRTELARTIDAISDRVSPKKNVRRVTDQLRERASQIDPVMAGAAAAAVVISVTVLLLLRRRKR